MKVSLWFLISQVGSYRGPEALYDYELFAVINYDGQIDNGHYTSFTCFQDMCHYDDDKVTPAMLTNMLGTSAPIYIAFYVKTWLEYKPYITPSCVLTRESETKQAKEHEREVEDELFATV
ncbi:hypothetical protein B0F90DRAFT_1919610 [Multifurca ochricompacta]|uniref:USP domain-containing protein n=1 Tax=Multifurca ochricompacta TaxID=376703 RepID=A0AAD4LYK7_9AGAM|nr:hypothetical protein B0F90DRAFT_1919610 [Multifurca ochricompacta]